MNRVIEWSLWFSDECPRYADPAEWLKICARQKHGEDFPASVVEVESAVLSLSDIRRKALISVYCQRTSPREAARRLNISPSRLDRLSNEALFLVCGLLNRGNRKAA